jgi:putative ABC transport system permease protein
VGVAIGVAAVAAIHHANRSVTDSFRESARAVTGRSDLAIVGAHGVPLDAIRPLEFLRRVASIAPLLSGSAVVDDGSREIVALLGVDYGGDPNVREMRLVEPKTAAGRVGMVASGSVLVPVPFATRHRLRVGSRLPLVVGGARTEVPVGGLLELSGLARASGGDIVVTDVFTAGRLLGRSGFVDRVDVALDPGVAPDAVRREIERRLAPGTWVEAAGRAAESAGRMARAFRFNLNALGLLTLLVGMFLVANAVSISVLRRRPEIATLRALGTSRSSIFGAFAVEGLAVGAAGTALGIAGGIALSRAALAVVSRTVSSVYSPTAKITAAGFGEPAIVAAAVGALSTLLAVIVPAVQATRVPPSPAMRPGSGEHGERRRKRGTRIFVASLALVLAVVLARARPIAGFPWLGFAAVALVVVALALFSPILVRTAASATRRGLARAFGAAGRLASGFFGGAVARNSIAVTALAMALGMTLAMIVTVASMRETVRTWVESSLRADLWVRSASGTGGAVGDLPPEVVSALAAVPGVAAVDPVRVREGSDPGGRTFTVGGGDFRVLARGIRTFRIAGVYRDFSNDRGTVLMDRTLYVGLFDDPRVTSAGVLARPGVSPDDLRRKIRTDLGGRFAIDVTTNRALRRQVLEIFDRTFTVTHALEGIAITVAILGIANALVASAVERRRSFALLRALGASRRQITSSVLLEASLAGGVAVAAAVLAGAAFAALLIGVINPQSFGWSVVLRVPFVRLAAAVVLVLAASVAAGIVPGRIAASVDPAAGLAEE